ncbi:DUF397 domain-containing protein [Streptomyces sp. SAS_270]|uniref:DUF397 domain-containing protein n=1 Tax=Streptomyces sp. SAS_270 TaxID=3412748 RepID=UPI00403C9FA1
MAAVPAPRWFKSSYSGGSGTECVECAYSGGAILVRDSKNAHGAAINVGSHAWQSFIRPLRQRSFPAIHRAQREPWGVGRSPLP